MKPKIVIFFLCAVALSFIAAAFLVHRLDSAPGHSTAVRRFEVSGQIRELDLPNKTVRIAHDEIPGYMPAMTMPLAVRDVSVLNGLSAGDQVEFELTVTENDSWISRVTKTSGAPESTSVPPSSPGDREAERVQAGESIPDFALLDQNGQALRLSDFRGKAVVLTFIYTRCPIPNFCPLMSKNFQALQQRLEKSVPGRYHLLSISMDPQFDRPAVLKEYAARFQADEKHWSFGTGTEDQINSVTALFGLFHEPENGLISHDLRTALISPEGRLVHLWKSNVWTPYEVQRMLEASLKGDRDLVAR